MSGAPRRYDHDGYASADNQPCRRCSAIAAVLALALLLLCGPVLVQPVGAYFRQSAPVLAQAQ